MFVLVAQTFSLWALVVLVIKIFVVCFVCGLLIWAIAQLPTPGPPFLWLVQFLRVMIIVVGTLIILFLLLSFIGITM